MGAAEAHPAPAWLSSAHFTANTQPGSHFAPQGHSRQGADGVTMSTPGTGKIWLCHSVRCSTDAQ